MRILQKKSSFCLTNEKQIEMTEKHDQEENTQRSYLTFRSIWIEVGRIADEMSAGVDEPVRVLSFIDLDLVSDASCMTITESVQFPRIG